MSTLRKIREEKGLTQVQLAEARGMKQATISDLETGNIRKPSLETAIRLSRVLDVSPEDLFPFSENGTAA